MIILQELNTSQSIYIIPRYYFADTMTITNETTKEVIEYSISPLQSNHYMVISTTFDLKEDTFYKVVITYNNDIVFRDRIFCTNQNVSSYSPNNDKFIELESDNEFIIIS